MTGLSSPGPSAASHQRKILDVAKIESGGLVNEAYGIARWQDIVDPVMSKLNTCRARKLALTWSKRPTWFRRQVPRAGKSCFNLIAMRSVSPTPDLSGWWWKPAVMLVKSRSQRQRAQHRRSVLAQAFEVFYRSHLSSATRRGGLACGSPALAQSVQKCNGGLT